MTTQNPKVSLLREIIQGAHQLLENVTENVTPEQASWLPGGQANPIGANYAHVILSADGVINGLLRGEAPLFATTWAGKTGVSEMPPQPSPESAGLPNWHNWAHNVQVDLGALREYAQAVYAATDSYLASLGDADLDRTIDLSGLGLGESTLAQFLNGAVLSNAYLHTGEIACLKGLQGEKGYPM